MGFGIATLGYGFLLTYTLGGGVIGVPLIMYGFYKAAATERRFLYACISGTFMLPYSVLLLLTHFPSILSIGQDTMIYQTFYAVFLLAWISMTFYFYSGVKIIALNNKADRLLKKANNRMILTIAVLFLGFLFFLNESIASVELVLGVFLALHIIIILNVWFLHSCFLIITTASQWEKDKELIAKEAEKQRKKNSE